MIFKRKHLFAAFKWLMVSLMLPFLLLSCDDKAQQEKPSLEYRTYGLYGYIGYDVQPNPAYGMGVSFYTAAWLLIDKPILGLQIGLPGTWIIPNNQDNNTIEFCPEGTSIHPATQFAPTYQRAFQTLEGGLGY